MDIFETLKTETIGIGGWWLSISGWLPGLISLSVGIATLYILLLR